MRLRRCDPPGKGLLDSEKLLKVRFPEPKHFFILGVAGETRGLRLSSDWKYDDAYGLGVPGRTGTDEGAILQVALPAARSASRLPHRKSGGSRVARPPSARSRDAAMHFI